MHRVAEMEEEMKKDEATTKLLAAIEKVSQGSEDQCVGTVYIPVRLANPRLGSK